MTQEKIFTFALIGNPNCGKSSVFNHLTGLRQKIGNFPGVTVDKKQGTLTFSENVEATLIDFPGAYSLYPNSKDERVVLNVLSNPDDKYFPDAVIYLADATNLEKHLLLLTQIKDIGIPAVLGLNMSDLVEKEKIEIDEKQLSEFLDMPVVGISGRFGKNLDKLKNAAFELLERKNIPNLKDLEYWGNKKEQALIQQIKSKIQLKNNYQALLWAHHFEKLPFLTNVQKAEIQQITEKEDFQRIRHQIDETMGRFQKITPALQRIIKRPIKKDRNSTDRVDDIITHKIFGPIIFFAIMFFVFQAIYAWAETPMDLVEGGILALGSFVNENLPQGWFNSLLTDGIIAGLAGILVFVPQIAILFFLISLLEEIGYMSRAVFMFDKIMQKFGLNGRSVVALISSGACAIPAVMATRTIGNWKERLITILVTPLISCSARIPVYTILIGFVVPSVTVWGVFNAQGLAFMGLYLLGIVAALLSAFVFKLILKTEESSFLMLELPQYRPPVWKNIWFTLKEKVMAFIIEAGKVIMVISIILWFLASYGPTEKMASAEKEAIELATQNNLDETGTEDLIASKKMEASYAGHLGKFIEPAIKPLGYDWQIGIALLTSFAAREVFVGTMATIYSIGSVEDEMTIRDKLAQAKNPLTGAPVYTFATSLSLLIFYVFAMQCMSTLAVVRRETGTWKWPIVQFLFMGALAYLGALGVYQIFG